MNLFAHILNENLQCDAYHFTTKKKQTQTVKNRNYTKREKKNMKKMCTSVRELYVYMSEVYSAG